jgi:hypothetical protein
MTSESQSWSETRKVREMKGTKYSLNAMLRGINDLFTQGFKILKSEKTRVRLQGFTELLKNDQSRLRHGGMMSKAVLENEILVVEGSARKQSSVSYDVLGDLCGIESLDRVLCSMLNWIVVNRVIGQDVATGKERREVVVNLQLNSEKDSASLGDESPK